ncbi:amidohydrolase family protein [Sphingomicrobium flavum]|uniref:amidohydrolase family protein n=1 Tax=Sphingomicrobium flavum TaxID=1229164 RepID=UPI0021ADD82D|nr:amidohydrolase family protein [Sphingomicrobium flavum]
MMTKAMLLAATALLLPSAALAQDVEYRVLYTGQDIGHVKVDEDGGTYRVDFDYKQNGRGPTISEMITVGDDGMPTDWKVEGRTTFGNLVEEWYGPDGNGGASWMDAAGGGSTDSDAFYISQNGSLMGTALLARAIMADEDMSITVLPSGNARMKALDTLDVTGPDGVESVTFYELSGLDSAPSYLIMEEDGDLLGVASPSFAVLKAGYEANDQNLRDMTERYSAERLANLQASFSRTYDAPVRITNVRIFDSVSKTVGAASDVVVHEGRIALIEPTGATPSDGEVMIDGEGAMMIPGMYEMHGHLGREDALSNVLYGITSVRDIGNRNEVLDKLLERVATGELAGPRVTRMGFIEGESPFSSRTGVLVSSADEAVEAVRRYAARGFHGIKLYNSMKPEWNEVAIAEAKRLGMEVAGHVPAFSSADAMIALGYTEVTHVNQLMLGWVLNEGEDTRTLFRFTAMKRFPTLDLDGDTVNATLDAMKAKGVAHEPTLGIHELGLTQVNGQYGAGSVSYADHMPPSVQRSLKEALFGADTPQERQEYVDAYGTILDVLRRMHAMGILLIPGTDMGGALTYHRELELFEQLGMSRADVLARATIDMARYLGQDEDLGSVERGKYADFFLVRGDPTADLGDLKKIGLVSRGGTFYVPDQVLPEFGVKPFAKGIGLPDKQ